MAVEIVFKYVQNACVTYYVAISVIVLWSDNSRRKGNAANKAVLFLLSSHVLSLICRRCFPNKTKKRTDKYVLIIELSHISALAGDEYACNPVLWNSAKKT
jgi:hypothetical protein